MEGGIDGNTDNGKGGKRGNHAWKCSGHTGGGNDDLDTACGGAGGKFLDGAGSAVGAEGMQFKRHFHLFEEVCGFAEDGQV